MSWTLGGRSWVLWLVVSCGAAACGAPGDCSDGCPDGQFCCEGTCSPAGTTGCECRDGSECGGGGGTGMICCDSGPNTGTCTLPEECQPTCTDHSMCEDGSSCCEGTCQVGECPCASNADCPMGSICCDSDCLETMAGVCPDAGPPPPGPDAGGPTGCTPFSAPIDTGADFVSTCPYDGAEALCTGGESGEVRFLDDEGNPLGVRPASGDRRLYSVEAWVDDEDSSLTRYVAVHEEGASYFDRTGGSFSFIQGFYPVSSANIVQAALVTTGGVVSGIALANNSSSLLEIAEEDSFGTFSRTRSATIAGVVAGVACIPDTQVCIVGTDGAPGAYSMVDWSASTPAVAGLGAGGDGTRNGACNASLCAFAELDSGEVTILDATVSPPAIVDTRAVGPSPLGVSAGSIGGAAALVLATADGVVHAIGGDASAVTVTTYAAPGTCAATGPRTATVYGDDCVAVTCPDASGFTLEGGPLGPPM